jgi:hypothetical protein
MRMTASSFFRCRQMQHGGRMAALIQIKPRNAERTAKSGVAIRLQLRRENFMVDIASDTVTALIANLRQRDAKVAPHYDAPGEKGSTASNEAEDDFREILEDLPDDAVEEEIRGQIDALNEDERLDLVAMMWIGRGDYTVEDWGEARRLARDEATHSTADYLLGTPLAGDYLEAGLNELGISPQE